MFIVDSLENISQKRREGWREEEMEEGQAHTPRPYFDMHPFSYLYV